MQVPHAHLCFWPLRGPASLRDQSWSWSCSCQGLPPALESGWRCCALHLRIPGCCLALERCCFGCMMSLHVCEHISFFDTSWPGLQASHHLMCEGRSDARHINMRTKDQSSNLHLCWASRRCSGRDLPRCLTDLLFRCLISDRLCQSMRECRRCRRSG